LSNTDVMVGVHNRIAFPRTGETKA
jgi:hypothetical protein